MLEQDFSTAVAKILNTLPNPHQTTASPSLIVISGLPGTGKSFLARKIAERLPCVIVESDAVRKTLFEKPTYVPDESIFVHRVAHAAIERLLSTGCHVICDATNLVEWHREKLYSIANKTNAKLVIVRTIAPESVIRERLDKRFSQRDPLDFSDADWDVHQMLKPELEPVRRPHLVVDTSGDMEAAVNKILRAIRVGAHGRAPLNS